MSEVEETASGGSEEANGHPRLMITKIVCENFKSYAGTKVLGPFHKCFTSIVGPNGSGKSNVIDAMLFVFGYRATKIRSKKVSVLIHKSDRHRELRSCSVTVHFQQIRDLPGPDDFEVVPGSVFTVSRTAYADNSSVYHLNGKKLQFKEIAALLRESGIDLDHNRFLILQGEVEQIAMMKPRGQTEHDEGMLEFLEDIIGSSRLKEPIEELNKKVDQLGEGRGEKLNRLKVVEREKDDLEAAKTEAEEFLAMQCEMARKQAVLYQKYIMECRMIEAQASEKKSAIDEQIAVQQNALQQMKEQSKGKEQALRARIRVYEKVLEEVDKCKAVLSACEQRDVKARQMLKNARANLKKTEKSLEKEQSKLAELEAAPDKCQKEIGELQDKLKVLKAQREKEEQKLTEVLAGLKSATSDLQKDKEKFERDLIPLSQSVNEARSKLDVAQAELDLFNEKATSVKRQLEEAKNSLTSTRGRIKDRKQEHKRLEKSVPEKKKELSQCEEELASLVAVESKLASQLKGLRAQAEEGRSSLEAFRSRGKVLQHLLQQRDTGALPGVHGRLGDLGTIDEQYDVAVSTACAALDHIVVDSMNTAVQCVSYLKRSGVGCATFIGLDKVEHLRANASKKMTTPEGVPRLFDLIKPSDPAFTPAFYFALRDTLVAETLDQATRIGLQGKTRHRVVTLQGQLVDQSGTMSGGGGRVVKGRMSSKAVSDVTPQQVEELTKRLADNERAAEECGERRRGLEQHVKELKQEISAMDVEMKKCQVDAQLLVDQEETIQSRISELEVELKAVKVDMSALQRLEKEVAHNRMEFEQAVAAAGKVEAEVKRLHDKIMEVGGSRVQVQQAKVDQLSSEIDGCTAGITKAGVASKTSERNAKKCRDKISSLEKEMESLRKKIGSAQEELESLEEEAREALQHREELVSKAKEEERVLAAEKESVDAGTEEQVALEGKLMDLRHEQDKYIAKVKENQQKVKHFNNQMAKLHLKTPPDEMSEEELQAVDTKTMEYDITMLEERLQQMAPNMAAIDEYKRKEAVYLERLEELNAITVERDEARLEFDRLRKQRLDEFMAGFGVITGKLKEMYQMITLGGDAELELVDSLDPFSEGIVFSVRPPKKSWKNISNLSGGEKTLSSLALVFALHHYKPSPLYVMDEIDAALDFRNVSIIAHYIKERTKNAQFIIISLRNNMFEMADRLVGIYKTYDITKSVTVDPRSFPSPAEGLRERNA